MKQFEEASIQFLDDQEKYLGNTSELFKTIGKDISPTNDINAAFTEALSDTFDIFLSDLDLNNISETDTGFTILNNVREKNDTIFLGLYTAFENTLTWKQLRTLSENDIKVYVKDNKEAFLDDLKSDYQKFLEEKSKQEAYKNEYINQFMGNIRLDVLRHLQNISNQEMEVPFTDEHGVDFQLKIKALYNEVFKKSKTGWIFISNWYENMKFINSLDKKEKNAK